MDEAYDGVALLPERGLMSDNARAFYLQTDCSVLLVDSLGGLPWIVMEAVTGIVCSSVFRPCNFIAFKPGSCNMPVAWFSVSLAADQSELSGICDFNQLLDCCLPTDMGKLLLIQVGEIVPADPSVPEVPVFVVGRSEEGARWNPRELLRQEG